MEIWSDKNMAIDKMEHQCYDLVVFYKILAKGLGKFMKKHYIITFFTLLFLVPTIVFASASGEGQEPATEALTETLAEEAEMDAAAGYLPGTYEAKAKGYGGYVTVKVTIDEDGKICEVKADGPGETPTVGGYALQDLPKEFIKAQSSEIDAYAGATFTRDAMIEAVEDCLVQASAGEGAQSSYQAGTYEAREKGYGGYVTVRVTIDENGKICEVKADGPDETPTVGGYALMDLPEKFIEAQSAAIDEYAGATFTRNALVAAVEACLAQAAQ